VFGKVGVANATLDQIAERAGVSKGTIYLYFANKEEVFRQTIRQALEPVGGTLPSALNSTPRRQLRDAIRDQWQFLTDEPVATASRLVASEQWQYPDLAELYGAQVVARFIDDVARILDSGVRAGEFRDLEPRVAARMLAALEVQSAGWRASGGGALAGDQSSEDALRELTEFYIQAISPLDSAFPQADGA
jgi:AcrR family transcriptional regulator